MAIGVFLLWPQDKNFLRISLLVISLTGFLLLIFKKNKSLLFFGILVLLDGFRVWESDHFLWVTRDVNKVYQKAYGVDLRKLPTLMFNPLTSRPARINISQAITYTGETPWSGYLTGNFLMTDYGGGARLARQQAVQKDKAASAFMQQESCYRLTPHGDIKMKSYANNQIIYQININTPSDLLENEMYFPGWKAKLSNGILLDAISSGPGLRAWHLPAGNYEMVTYFEMPYLKLSAGISLLGLGVWIILIRRSYKVSRESNRSPLT